MVDLPSAAAYGRFCLGEGKVDDLIDKQGRS